MRTLLTPSMQVVKVRDQNGFEFYLDREGNPYTYQGDRLTHLSGLNELDGLAGFFKKVSDRLFRDFPKAVVNVFTSPFLQQSTVDQPTTSQQNTLLFVNSSLVLCSIGALAYMAWEENQSKKKEKKK